MTASIAPVDRPPLADDVYDGSRPETRSTATCGPPWPAAAPNDGCTAPCVDRSGPAPASSTPEAAPAPSPAPSSGPTRRRASRWLDRSEGMLDQAGPLGVARMRGDITSLPLRDGSFDLVTAAWVLETLRDPARAVSELLRVLAPEGQLLAVFSAQPPSALIARLRRPVERHPRWLRRPLPPPGRSPVPPLRGLAPQTTAAGAGRLHRARALLSPGAHHLGSVGDRKPVP